jgi:hypothetical protein
MTNQEFCSFDHCTNPQRSKGYCSGHYQQYKTGKPLTSLKHRNKGKTCTFEGCAREAHAGGLCVNHGRQLRSNGELKPLRQFGGHGWHTNSKGYIIRKMRVGGKLRTVFQHREVMEDFLGRALLSHEEVHHKYGDKTDNRIENLELWTKSQPAGIRAKDALDWAEQIIALYGPDRKKLQ